MAQTRAHGWLDGWVMDWAGSCNCVFKDEDEGPYLPIHNSGSRKTQKSCHGPQLSISQQWIGACDVFLEVQ